MTETGPIPCQFRPILESQTLSFLTPLTGPTSQKSGERRPQPPWWETSNIWPKNQTRRVSQPYKQGDAQVDLNSIPKVVFY